MIVPIVYAGHAVDLYVEYHSHRFVSDDGAPALGWPGDDPDFDGGVVSGGEAW